MTSQILPNTILDCHGTLANNQEFSFYRKLLSYFRQIMHDMRNFHRFKYQVQFMQVLYRSLHVGGIFWYAKASLLTAAWQSVRVNCVHTLS